MYCSFKFILQERRVSAKAHLRKRVAFWKMVFLVADPLADVLYFKDCVKVGLKCFVQRSWELRC